MPVSTATAQITATDVVDKAIPPISAAGQSQPNPNRHSRRTAVKGTANDTPPISRLACQVRRSWAGSISHPALNVRTTLPKLARNASQSGVVRCRVLPSATPRRISMTATDTPTSTETIPAATAATPRTMATNSDVMTEPALHDRGLLYQQEPSAMRQFGRRSRPGGDPSPQASTSLIARPVNRTVKRSDGVGLTRYDPGKPAVDLAGPTVFVGDLPSRPMGPASTLACRRAGTWGRRKTLRSSTSRSCHEGGRGCPASSGRAATTAASR